MINDNQLIYYCDSENGINTCGFRVNSILLNSGAAPHEIFENLIVPNFALGYFSSHRNNHNEKEEEEVKILDDNLYNQLYHLMTNPDSAVIKKNSKTRHRHRKKEKHNKTKHRVG